jgi:hypothetical protein
MIKGIVQFNRAVFKMPIPWRIWMMLLMAVNMIVPFFFLDQIEARVVLVTMIVSAALMMAMTEKFGFTRILGLGHIPWIPLVVYLWTRLGEHPADQPFGLWIRLVMVLNSLSLVIDIVDVARYIRGDRERTVQGL